MVKVLVPEGEHKLNFTMQKGFQSESPSARELPIWSLWRQDDSGNRFLVEANLTESQAKSMVAELEARGHKQTYWWTDDALNPRDPH